MGRGQNLRAVAALDREFKPLGAARAGRNEIPGVTPASSTSPTTKGTTTHMRTMTELELKLAADDAHVRAKRAMECAAIASIANTPDCVELAERAVRLLKI